YDKITDDNSDAIFREYFHGGRTQCFEGGIITPQETDSFKVFDITSQYPYVMKMYKHPITFRFHHYTGKQASLHLDDCDFAIIKATNNNALPVSDKGLKFDVPEGIFHATGHEIRQALDLDLIKIEQVLEVWEAQAHTTFAEFIDHFFAKR